MTVSSKIGRRTTGVGLAVALACAQLVATTAYSHHSFAMYDTHITETFTGRLKQFIPGANHAQIIFEVLDADGATSLDENGEPVLWGVETGPAAQLARQGVTLKSFPVGTVINVNLNPLRDGRHFGSLAREGGRLISCGMQLPESGCNEKTGSVFLDRD